MKERLLALRPILLRVIGYPLFFLFFFVVFLYATFPLSLIHIYEPTRPY